MYQLNESTIKFYLENPEMLEQRKYIWMEIFENKLRRRRASERTKIDFTNETLLESEIEWLMCKHRLEIEARPLSETELLKWKMFEDSLKVWLSYWRFPEDEDFNKLL